MQMVLPSPLVIHDLHLWLFERVKLLTKARDFPRPISSVALVVRRVPGSEGLFDLLPALDRTGIFYGPTPWI